VADSTAVGRPEGIALLLRRARFAALACAGLLAAAVAQTAAADTETLKIGGSAPVQTIKPGFLGLSLEYYAVLPYTGYDPRRINPVFLQLIRNLNSNQTPSLRIGGDSTDWTWWPVPGMKKPGGIKYELDKRWLAATASLVHQLGAHVILGINLEANSTKIAQTETSQFIGGIGQQSIDALEPGNEPELYGSWTYYRTRKGRKVFGRPASYSFKNFENEFGRLHHALGSAPLAGPTTGSINWMKPLGSFLTSEPQLALVTLHRYPLQSCFITPSRPQYPTIAHLLSPNSSRGLANSVVPYVNLAHSRHVAVRIDEMNSNGCGNVPQVTDTFASALWVLDAVTAMANIGVDGVNIHTYPHSSYELFTFHRSNSRWYGQVSPEYYGLMMFAIAAPPGSQPLSLSGSATGNLSTWATSGPDNQTRVLLINDDPAQARTVSIDAGLRVSPARYLRLEGNSLGARTGVTVAGGSFGSATDSGQLVGGNRVDSVVPVAGSYTVTAPPATATLVVLPANVAARDR
jgi:hypothetical protein